MSALPLITFDPETSRYACDERAMAMLRDLPGPVGVVACAGRYRTGKSFLLNRVLLGKKNGTGFGVGNTVHACTKGLWIWSEPLRNRKNMRVLVVDTEGIGALDASSVHDTRIFALAVLLSSSFFFNSVGSIDDAAVQTLSLVCALSKHIKISSSSGGGDDGVEESPEALAAFFPEFLWIVRDFTLQLVTKTGEPLSEHDYLEEALRDVPATLEDADQKNQTRRLLRTYFRNRDCLTLVRPTSKEADLQKLDHVARLRPEFVRKGKVLRRRLIDECPPKSMGGTSLNGAMLARLCELFTTALNNGGVPVMDDALTSILRLRVQKVAQDARSWFDDRARVVPCTTPRDVGQRLAKLVDSTLARFDREVAREDAGVAARTEREALHLALRRTMEERIRTARETHRVKVRSVAERELRRGIMALGATAASASSTDGADDAALARMLAHVEATLTGGGGGAAADDGGGNGDDDMHAEPARAALWGALRMLLDEEPEVRRHFGGASAAAAAEEKLDRLRSELDEARQKHDRETQAMRQTLAETQTQHETEADDLRHQLQTAHEEEETLRRRLDEMRDETETARQDLSTFRERAIALEQEAVQLKAAAEENVSLRDEVERSAERLEESERSFRETTEQIRKETLSAIRQSREQAAEATAQLEGLRRELRGAEANGTRLEAELDHQRKQHAAAQAQHRATLEARQKEQRDAEEQHRTSLREAEERLVQLRQETDRRSAQQEREEASLKRRLQRVQEELEESRKRPRVSAETTLELARVRKELDWSEQQRDQLTQRCDEYKSTVIDLRDQLRTQRQSHHVQELRKSLSLQ